MVMNYYFIKKHAYLPRSYCCPFLKCRLPFASAVDMVEHIKICSKFRESEMWCPACGVWSTYYTSKSGNCSWKRHSFAEKMLRPIKSISRPRPTSIALSQTHPPRPSSTPITIEILRRTQPSDIRVSNPDEPPLLNMLAEIDSQCVISELYDDSISRGAPAEMDAQDIPPIPELFDHSFPRIAPVGIDSRDIGSELFGNSSINSIPVGIDSQNVILDLSDGPTPNENPAGADVEQMEQPVVSVIRTYPIGTSAEQRDLPETRPVASIRGQQFHSPAQLATRGLGRERQHVVTSPSESLLLDPNKYVLDPSIRALIPRGFGMNLFRSPAKRISSTSRARSHPKEPS
jgi:hypothetical protein